jgi:hypothetical protein
VTSINGINLKGKDQLETEYQALTMLNHTVKLLSDMGKNTIVDNVPISAQKSGLLAGKIITLIDRLDSFKAFKSLHTNM